MSKKKAIGTPADIPMGDTGFEIVNEDLSVHDRIAETQQLSRFSPEPSFGDSLAASFQRTNIVGAIWSKGVGQQYAPDPDFQFKPEMFDQLEGISDEYKPELLKARSKAEFDFIADEIRRGMELDKKTTFTTDLVAGILDPTNWLLDGAVAPLAALGKASRMKRIISAGTAAAGSNVANELALQQIEHGRGKDGVTSAAAVGFVLGGTFGSFLKPHERAHLDKNALNLTREADIAELHANGVHVPQAEFSKSEVNALTTRYLIDQFGTEGLDAVPVGTRVVMADLIKQGRPLEAHLVAKEQKITLDNQIAEQRMAEANQRVADKQALEAELNAQRESFARQMADLAEQRKAAAEAHARRYSGREMDLDEMRDWYQRRVEGMNETERAMHLGRLKKSREAGSKGAIEEMLDGDLSAPKPMKADGGAMREAFEKALGEQYAKRTPATFEERMKQINAAAEEVRAKERAKQWAEWEKKQERQKEAELNRIWEEAKLNPVDLPARPETATAATPAKADAPQATHSKGDEVEFTKGDDSLVGTITKVSEDGKTIVVKDVDDKTHRIKLEDITSHKPAISRETGTAISKKEEDAFVQSGSIGAAQARPLDLNETVHVSIPWFGGKKVKIPLQFDWYSRLISTENLMAHKLIRTLITDPVKGGWNNVSEFAEMYRGKWRGEYYRAMEDQFNVWALRNNVGAFQRMKKRTEFSELITAGVRGVESALAHPEVKAMVSTVNKLHSEILEAAKKAGVEGAEEILPNPNYMMRRFNQSKIRLLMEKYDAKEIGDMIGRAILRARDDLDPEKALKIGNQYLKAVRELAYRTDITFGRELASKEQALIRESLKEIGTDPADIEAVMDVIMGRSLKKEGEHARLKDRVTMDETHAEELVAKDGSKGVVTIQDLFENDARVLFDVYSKQMSGLTSFAKMGIKSEADWTRRLEEIKSYAVENNLSGPKHQQMMDDLNKIRNFILGRPMETQPFGNMERILRTMRDINFFRMMGQVGFAQLTEIGNVTGLAGIRAARMHIPAFKDMIEMAKKGLINDEFAKDIIKIGGFGSEAVSNHPLVQFIEDGVEDAALSKVEQLASQAKHLTADVSGLNSINNVLRQFVARAFVQKYADYALGVTKMSDDFFGGKHLSKLETAGLHEGNIDGVFNDLRKFVQVDSNGKVTRVDFDAWQSANPKSAEDFQMAIWRESRRAVQEHTIGETAPWMHSTLGKVLTQFRSFMLVAYAKQSLYGLTHMDINTATAWMLSSVIGATAYMAQTSLNFAHNEAEMEKRLSSEELFKAALTRGGWSSIVPAFIDTAADLTLGEPVFQHSRSSGQAASLITGNPTVSLMNGVYQAAKGATNEAFMGDEHMWTKSQVKSSLNTVMPNWLLVRNFVDAMSSEFPKKDPNAFPQ